MRASARPRPLAATCSSISVPLLNGFSSPRRTKPTSGPSGEPIRSTAKSTHAIVRPGPTGASAYSTGPAAKWDARIMSPIAAPWKWRA
jgi:hypothetical protein